MLALCAQHSKHLPCLEFGMYVHPWSSKQKLTGCMLSYSVKVLRTLHLKNRIIVNVLVRCELYVYMCTKVAHFTAVQNRDEARERNQLQKWL